MVKINLQEAEWMLELIELVKQVVEIDGGDPALDAFEQKFVDKLENYVAECDTA